TAARERYVAANAPALLAEGYLAIVQQISEGGRSGEGSALDPVCARISAGEFKDGAAWVAQLRTALAAFTRPAAAPDDAARDAQSLPGKPSVSKPAQRHIAGMKRTWPKRIWMVSFGRWRRSRSRRWSMPPRSGMAG